MFALNRSSRALKFRISGLTIYSLHGDFELASVCTFSRQYSVRLCLHIQSAIFRAPVFAHSVGVSFAPGVGGRQFRACRVEEMGFPSTGSCPPRGREFPQNPKVEQCRLTIDLHEKHCTYQRKSSVSARPREENNKNKHGSLENAGETAKKRPGNWLEAPQEDK